MPRLSSAISSSSGKEHLELIRAAGERASPQLADVLMKIAQGPDREPSQAAIRAVRNAAGPEQAPALLAAVLKIQNANERREAAMTLASVIKRAPGRPNRYEGWWPSPWASPSCSSEPS